MMSLLNKIRDDSLASRKARAGDKAVFLVTLFAEASRPGKDAGNRDSTDAEVTAVLKKFVKNTEEFLKALGDKPSESRERLALELGLLRAYLPRQVDAQELAAAITEAVAALPDKGPKQMGAVMAQLQARFAGNFDKAGASQLVRQALQG